MLQSGVGIAAKPTGAENAAAMQKKAALHQPAARTFQLQTIRNMMPKLAIMTGRKKAKFSPKLTALYLLLLEVGAARSRPRKRRIILALTNTSKIDEMFIHYGPNNGGRSGRPAL